MNPSPVRSNPPIDLRIGFLTAGDLSDPGALSGMPYHMGEALAAQGARIIPISTTQDHTQRARILSTIFQRMSRSYRRKAPMRVKSALDRVIPPLTRALVLKQCRRHSRIAQANLGLIQHGEDSAPLDAIFGCNTSKALIDLRTELPVIYASDATGVMIQPNYPALADRARPYRRALLDAERLGVSRADAAIFASPIACRSAEQDLGIDPQRTHIIPMGAHVVPLHPQRVSAPSAPPTRDECRLLIVAADPIRKRVDLAVRVTDLLRRRSINATLYVVGPGTPSCRDHEGVDLVGPLRLSDTQDRAIHQQLLEQCHLQLLPSLGEAFGIAPIESAHFARPSIVSGVGGLSFVVQHDQTGLVLDPDAQPEEWADAIESLISSPDRYRALSIAALDRARNELNWDAWGRAAIGVIRWAIEHHSTRSIR